MNIHYNINISFFLGFPKVLGCVDGTQIRISTPSANEADFVNRKGFHSLNVQVLFFLNVCLNVVPEDLD